LASLSAVAGAATRNQEIREYDLKAVFLFNFAQFVEWPPEAFLDSKAPLTIGILGDDPFGGSLDEVVANETAHDRTLSIRRYRTIEEAEACHILFISATEASRMESILAALAHRSILTVGDSKDFTAHAGMVGFEVVGHRLRLRINRAAVNAAHLTISSQLLRQAEVVNPPAARE